MVLELPPESFNAPCAPPLQARDSAQAIARVARATDGPFRRAESSGWLRIILISDLYFRAAGGFPARRANFMPRCSREGNDRGIVAHRLPSRKGRAGLQYQGADLGSDHLARHDQ